MALPKSGLQHAPHLEWILAAQWAGYRFFHEWQDLTGDEQALLIAAWREQQQIQAVLAWQQSRKQPKAA